MPAAITIVILSWNGREDSLRCLNSLGRISSPAFRIILVDNGSSDGTAAAVRERFPQVEIISTGKNLGFPGGNNVGIRRALETGSEFICLLNNDTVVDPAFLREFLRAAERHPDAGIFGGRVNFYDRPERVWSQGINVHPWFGRIITPYYDSPEARVPDRPAAADAVSAAAMFVRREVFERVGLIDERYFLLYEDIDFCLRARSAGFRVLTVPSARVRHRVSASMGGEGSMTIIYYATRNHLLVVNHCLPLPLPLRGGRNLLVILYNFLFVTLTSRSPAVAGLRAWGRGVRDYFRGRWGEAADHPGKV